MPASDQPVLIVNADDLGWNRECTDRIFDAFAAGRISSATAMVCMHDSDRAAEIALDAGIPVGLHLNLTDPFTDASAPATRRSRQLAACGHFFGWRFRVRSWSYDVRIKNDVEAAISDQLERFEELYGKPPTHVDGHNHVHACPNVALAAPLASVERMRDSLWAWPSVRSGRGLARALRRGLVARRFLRPRFFFDIAQLYRDLDRPGRAARIRRACQTSVEVMCHPGFSRERSALCSRDWAQLLEFPTLGSYSELSQP